MENNLHDLINLTHDNNALSVVFDSIPLHIIVTDQDGKILIANKAVERITGFSKKEIIGKTPKLWGQQMDPSFYKDFWKIIKENKKTYNGIVQNKRKNGVKYHASVKVTPILDKDKKVIGFCGVEQDITEIQKLSDEHDMSEKHRSILKRTMDII